MHGQKMWDHGFAATAMGLLAVTLLLSGCQQIEYAVPTSTSSAISGAVQGGNLPISGSSIQLYAAGSTGDASAAQPLLTKTVKTDANGNFSIGGDYTCPSADAPVYIVATGGVSQAGGSDNSAISLMTVLGPCGQISSSSTFDINEVTTIASTWSLRDYMSSITVLGSAAGDGTFTEDIATDDELVNVATGTSPGLTVPAGYVVQVSKLYALADVMAACINSNGGVAGDGSPCGNFFASVQPSVSGKAPTETIGAALAIAHSPAVNVDRIYQLLPATTPFAPTLTVAPADWTLPLLELPATPTITPAAGTYSAGQQVTITTSTSGAAIYYTTDGSQPTLSSPVYSAPIALNGSETIHAITSNSGLLSGVAAASYTVTTSHLVFITQPSNAALSSTLNPAPAVEFVDDLSGKVVTNAASPVTLSLSANPGHASLNGQTTAQPVNGVATFPNLSLAQAAAGYTLQATTTGLPAVVSNSFSIIDPQLSFTLPNTPLTVGNTLTGAVLLSSPASSAVTVALTSSSPSSISVSPSSVIIPAGSASGSFTYKALAAGSSTITAAAANLTPATAQVSATSEPVITLTIPNPSLAVGTSGTGSVSLSSPATSAVTVALTSSSPSSISVSPSSVTIPAGSASGSFTYKALAAGSSTLTASAANYTSATAQLSATANAVITLTIPNPSLAVGTSQTGSVSLSSPATSAVTVALTSSSPSAISVTPSSITIPVGSASGSFTYKALAAGSSTITATAANYTSATTQLSATANAVITLTIPDPSLTVGTSQTGSISLSSPATSAVTVAFTSSSPSSISVSPSSITIPAGSASGSFTYKALAAGSSTITASAANLTPATAQVSATAEPVITLTIPNPSLTVGTSQTGSVSLPSPATSAVAVALTSSSPSAISVTPSSVTIPAGSASGSFTYKALAAGSSTITASAANLTPATAQLSATANAVITLTIPNPSLTVGTSQTGSVSLSLPATFAVSVALTSSSPSAISVTPSSVTIPAGSASGSFTYKALAAGSSTITAAAANFTPATAQLSATADPVISLKIPNPSPTVGTAQTGSVSLSAPATSAITVALTSSSSSSISVTPSSVTISAGSASGSFTYKALAAGSSTITAAAANLTPASAQVSAAANGVISLTLPNANPFVGTSQTATVSLSAPATSAVTIAFTSSSSSISVTPSSITIPAGSASASFTYNALAAGTSTITATAANYTSATAQVSVAAEPVISLTVPNASMSVGATLTGTVTLSSPATSAITLALTSSAASTISVAPASLTIAAGSSSGSFTYTAASAGSTTITASAPNYTSGTIAVAASAVVAAPAITTPTIPSTLFGLTVLNYTNLTPTLTFGTTRTWDAYPDVDWSDVNPAPGVFQFKNLDQFVSQNQALGVDIIYTLGRTPQWASSQPLLAGSYGLGQCAPPSNMSTYDAYLTALVTHEKGKIKYYELWNEPQSTQMYCGTIQQMVAMAHDAAQIIKSIDPNALIISPGVTGGPGPAWLSSFLSQGGAAYVDGIAFHGYWSAAAEDNVTVVKSYQAAMAANGVSSKFMIDTEASWAGMGDIGTPSTTAQVSYVGKTYLLQYSLGVSRFVWYAYDGGAIWGGMLTASGAEGPAATAYKQVYNWMVGASMSTPCSQASNGVYTCGLTRSGGYSAQAVWIPKKTGTYTVPAGFTQYQDLAGAVHPITGTTVQIQDQPILLETGNIP
jgi:hypothetical protein